MGSSQSRPQYVFIRPKAGSSSRRTSTAGKRRIFVGVVEDRPHPQTYRPRGLRGGSAHAYDREQWEPGEGETEQNRHGPASRRPLFQVEVDEEVTPTDAEPDTDLRHYASDEELVQNHRDEHGEAEANSLRSVQPQPDDSNAEGGEREPAGRQNMLPEEHSHPRGPTSPENESTQDSESTVVGAPSENDYKFRDEHGNFFADSDVGATEHQPSHDQEGSESDDSGAEDEDSPESKDRELDDLADEPFEPALPGVLQVPPEVHHSRDEPEWREGNAVAATKFEDRPQRDIYSGELRPGDILETSQIRNVRTFVRRYRILV